MVALSALCALALALPGCGTGKKAERDEKAYAGLVAETISLYEHIEPLRASSLGMTRCDSLLFTFSDEEVASALARLRKLESRYSSFGAASLAPRDIDNIEVIAYWLRGEIFALADMKSFRFNPLIYCWAAEQALWEIPSRQTPPHPGELAAYRVRIRKIPSLFANARRLLDNPAEAHTRFAAARLDSIAAGFGRLEAAIMTRYDDSPAAELDEARSAVESFHRFVADSLASRSLGRTILGTENLSKIFLYDELLNADPNTIMGKAESSMRRLQSLKGSLERRIEFEKNGGKIAPDVGPPGPPAPAAGGRGAATKRPSLQAFAAAARPKTAPASSPVAPKQQPVRRERPLVLPKSGGPRADERFDVRINRLYNELAAGSASTFGAKAGPRLVIEYPAHVDYPMHISKLPYAAVPPAGPLLSQIYFTEPFNGPQCLPYGIFSSGAGALDDDELRLALLRALPGALEPDADRCAEKDTVRAIFSSGVFREAWFYLGERDRTANMKTADPILNMRLLDDEIRALAIMVVVFRIHGGAMTSQEGADYLAQSAGMSGEEASKEVLAASISPGLAYRGIAMVLVENMMETISYVNGIQRPEQQMKKLLLENRDLPLPLIEKKIEKD
jgi:hypothetical protein